MNIINYNIYMCWSFDVSLGTLIFSTLCSLYLYTRNEPNDRLYAIYVFAIGLMQGADTIAWYSIDNSIPSLNKFSAILSRVLIGLQIPMIYWYLYKSTGNSIYSNVVLANIVYLFYIGYLIWNEYDSFKITVNPTCKNECHLEWSWLYKMSDLKYLTIFIIYSFFIVYPLWLLKDRRKYLFILISLLTFMYSLYKFSDTHIWGSYWCSMVNLWAIVAVFY
jgi:hypothetical protein